MRVIVVRSAKLDVNFILWSIVISVIQTNTIRTIDNAITELSDNGFLTACSISKRKIKLEVLPLPTPIVIDDEEAMRIFNEVNGKGVSWEQVLKVYLWIMASKPKE